MKKKISIWGLIFIVMLLMSSKVFASEDVTKKLYQDITINNDGSMTIKEAAILEGKYNGRSREIKFKGNSQNKFTGIYSNFSGNTDIYDGTSIKDIKIYDISQSNFNNIDDIDKIEKIYKKVDNASNGKYGVYTAKQGSKGIDFKIYCPSKKKKVFCMEYTITDAVVVHNDIAELYWNVLGTNYREQINDFQVRVHLPEEDNDLRVWTHGPLSGSNKILDDKTVLFTDKDVKKYEPETIRIMFNKNLVPNANKQSNVNGREYILQYEQEMADSANYERTQQKYNDVNKAIQEVLELEEFPSVIRYDYAKKCVEKIADSAIKEELLQRIENQKEEVNKEWKERVENKIDHLREEDYRYLNKSNVELLQETINEGINEEAKNEYNKLIQEFNDIIDKRDAKTRSVCKKILLYLYVITTIIVIYKLIKIILEKNKFKGKYYRDFPSEDNPYVLEYLIKRKTTNLSISATILNLITKKVIKLNENPQDKNNVELILINENYSGTDAENKILQILFNMVGKNNSCYLEKLKTYGKSESRAIRLSNEINAFKSCVKTEVYNMGYFYTNIYNILTKVLLGTTYFISICMIPAIFKGLIIEGLSCFGIMTLINIVYYIIISKDKNRSPKGKLEYSKWLAHKRFLKHFSMLKQRDLPEIELWEKYLVTATVLGCADKVQKTMKMNINEYTSSDINTLVLATSINNNIIRTINSSINTSVSTARTTISAASSSSGGGFGGGSSGGGGFGGRRWPEEVVSNILIFEKRNK